MRLKATTLIIAFLLTFTLFGCASAQNTDGDNPSDQTANIIKLPGDLPYITYMNPVLVGEEMYVCVGKTQSSIDKVVNYNVATQKSKVIFESQFTEASISNTIANENWVIWVDADATGASNIIYALNRTSDKITKLQEYNAVPGDYVIAAPYLAGDMVAWVELDQNKNATVKLYHLQTDNYESIAQLKEPNFYNNFVYIEGDKLIWTDCIDGKGYYNIYDIKTKDVQVIEAPYPYPGYAQMFDGRIYSINFYDYHKWTDQDFGYFDIVTSEYHSANQIDPAYINQFRIGGNVLAVVDSKNKLQLIKMENDKTLEYDYPLATIDTIDVSYDGRFIVGTRATPDNDATLMIFNQSK